MSAKPEGAVTVLFTDVEGSTDLRTRLGDEVADALLHMHEEIVRERVAHHGGREVKSLGDGFMVAFGSPRKAISCAIEIQRALDDRNRLNPGREIRIRIGINAGEVSEVAGDLMGAAVNAASRIAGKARGGQILIANVVKDLAGARPDLSYVDRGLYWLKGFPERWRLFEVLRRAPGPAEELTAPAVGKTRFIGREAERADLRRFVEQAASGYGGFVMIGGEPGVGKTRISEEVAEEAAGRGMMALVGHCPETESGLPYAPVVEIMEATMRGVSKETLRIAFGESASELAKMVPELRRIFPNLPPPLELPPEQERRYLFNSFTEFVERASRMQPLLFVLEDLHWADEPTLLLLQFLAERVAGMPVLLLGTYRDVELDVDRPLARTLEGLIRRRLAHRVNLNRLGREDVSEMLNVLSGRETPSSLVEAVYNETEGNCFFVEEVYQHLNEEGKLFDSSGGWRNEVRVGEIEVPEGVRLVLGRRLARLSEGARRALSASAVIGRNFTYELAEALDEVGGDTLLDAIEEAQRARLLTSSEDPLRPRFEFAHELIRQTLLSALALPRRQRLHLRVADAIERVYADNLDPHIADIANHLYQAGAAADLDRATKFLLRAGDRAMDGAAFEEALRSYERAASLRPDDTDQRRRATILEKLGFVKRITGRVEEALDDLRAATEIYAALDEPQAVGALCRAAVDQLGWSGRFVEAVEMAQRGLLALGDAESADRARLLGWAGVAVTWAGAFQSGSELIDEALEVAERLGDDELRGFVLATRASQLYPYCLQEEAARVGLEAAELLRGTGAYWDLCNALAFVAFSLVGLGRFEELRAIEQEASSLSRRLGHFGALGLVERARALRDLATTADLDAYNRFASGDYDLFHAAGQPWDKQAYTFQAKYSFYRGDWDEALELAERGTAGSVPGALENWDASMKLLIHAYRGEHDAARRIIEQRRGRLARVGEPTAFGDWALTGAVIEASWLAGQNADAAALRDAIDGCPLVVMTSVGIRNVETWRAIAAAAAEDIETAERRFAATIQLADELPNLIEQPESRRLYAKMLVDRGGHDDRERARTLLEEASAMYLKIGMPRHIEMCEEMLKAL
jgi:class 3 adenylate cyclase/tetratricopeptide (TPR) repeat protein